MIHLYMDSSTADSILGLQSLLLLVLHLLLMNSKHLTLLALNISPPWNNQTTDYKDCTRVY